MRPGVTARGFGLSLAALVMLVACGQKDPTTPPIDNPTGTIVVTSSVDGAVIMLDRLPTGRVTPDTLEVSPGAHEITVSLECHEDPDAQLIEVETSGLESVYFELLAVSSSISVDAPLAAAVIIDDTDTGRFTPAVICVAAGEHTVALELAGFRGDPPEIQVTVAPDEVATAAFNLDLVDPGAAVVHKVVLCEDYSNFACAPCPAADAALQAAMAALEPGAVTSINPHVYWPGAGDPMYLFNRPANDARIILNEISAAPTIAVGGTSHLIQNDAQSVDAIRSAMEADLAHPAPVAIGVRSSLSTAELRITVNVWGIEAGLPADLLFFTCVIEEEVTLDPPGPNGQSHYAHVLRHLFPTPARAEVGGEPIGDLTPGERRTFNYVYDLPAGVDPSLLAVIAFAQRGDGDRRVLQTGMNLRP